MRVKPIATNFGGFLPIARKEETYLDYWWRYTTSMLFV
jgi:hypothetical protein